MTMLPIFEDWTPIVLRIVLGAAFIAHGYPKLTGQSRQQSKGFMKTVGIPGPLFDLAAILEFLGGIGLIFGLLTQVIGVLLFLEMIGTTILSKRKLGKKYMLGYELDLAYLAGALTLALLGPGPFSIDRLIGLG